MASLRPCLLIVFAAIAAPALAQEQYGTLIENTAHATIEETPTSVVFRFNQTFEGETFAEVATAAGEFAPSLRETLKNVGQERASLRITGPMIPDVNTRSIHLVATVRIALAGSTPNESRSTVLTKLSDAMAGVADSLACQIDGPQLDVGNRPKIENQAVQRAIEYAFGRAEAASEIMRLNIVAVDRADIQEVIWHDRPTEDSDQEASADRISVTARVRVTYLAMPPD